ncbi:MAG: hypothetical protein ABJB74_11660 [Gemmatimonas sp.]
MNASRTLRVNVLLASMGAVCGAVASLPITALGKLIAGAPPASTSTYLWNMGVLAALAAIGSPFLTWSALRRVPLWRAVTEPGIGAVAGGAIALAIGAPLGFLVLMPVGVGIAAWRLHHVYREPKLIPSDPLLGSHNSSKKIRATKN